jgi:hypothetical protein
MLAPQAIIATFENEDRTRAFHLTADGTIVAIERERRSDMWSPPEDVASIQSCIPAVKELLQQLVAH